MPVARLDQIVKRYGAEEVLRGVSLSVEEGEWLALTGRSGSGKSTLLHILGGLDRRFSGTAEVFGRGLGGLDDRALARFRNAEVGFVFQAFNLLDHLTVRENVALPAFFAGGKSAGAPDGERALAALERVGMAGHAARRPGELSGGQKQRVALARALYGGPRLLLADEPTGNLDGETGRQIIELFGKLHQEGLTLIVVTHQERVSEAAGRVLRLEDGRLLA
ncbi:MAG TPA: ABC transporter ATP-binding protein [Polyangia bacterium]|jgi:putative ABC transport system ATP-binding protein